MTEQNLNTETSNSTKPVLANRLLKFRAWDDGKKQWLLGYEYPNLGGFSLDGECVLMGEWTNICTSFMFENNGKKRTDLKVTQSINLKDKFGKEIYEGDIVRWDDGSNGEKWRVAVVELTPALQFKIVKINCDFIQSAKEGYVFKFGSFIYTDTHNHLEIIGNVFESDNFFTQS